MMSSQHKRKHAIFDEEEEADTQRQAKRLALHDLLQAALGDGPADVSSAEEEVTKKKVQTLKKQHRRKPIAPPPPAPPAPPSSTALAPKIILYQVTKTLPQLKDMSDLLIEHPHLGVSTDCEIAAQKLIKNKASASSSSSSSSKPTARDLESEDIHRNLVALPTQSPAEHLIASRQVPWQITMAETKLRALQAPSFYLYSIATQTLGQEELEDKLHKQITTLPFLSAALETELLQEAGVFVDPSTGESYDFPVCVNNNNCVFMKYPLPNHIRPFRGTAIMFEKEYYTNFLINRRKPSIRRQCVGCARVTLVDWIVFARSLKLNADTTAHADSPVFETEGKEVYQCYYNKTNSPGGYYAEYLITPEAQETICEPICRFNLSYLRACFSVRFPTRIQVDQSALIWQPSAIPIAYMGETVENFQ